MFFGNVLLMAEQHSTSDRSYLGENVESDNTSVSNMLPTVPENNVPNSDKKKQG